MHYIAGLWRDLGSLRLFRLSVGSRAMAKPSGEGSAVACLPLCPDVDSAVYVDRLAGDVVTVFYQETGGPGDLFGLAEASERHLFAKFLLGFLGDVGDHIGLGKAEQPGLGRRVVGLADVAGLPDERTHVDDLAPALVRHVRQDGVDRVEGAVEVYLYYLVPVFDGELLERAVYVDPRIVDQDVYPVVLLYRLVYKVLGLLRIRDVGMNRDCLATVLRDLCDQLFGRLFAPRVIDYDFGSPARQLFGYGSAQTPARACHHDNGFFQSAHAILPFRSACEIEFIDNREQAQTRYLVHLSPLL